MQLPCSLLDTALSRRCVLFDEQEATEKKVGALVRPSCTRRFCYPAHPALPTPCCHPLLPYYCAPKVLLSRRESAAIIIQSQTRQRMRRLASKRNTHSDSDAAADGSGVGNGANSVTGSVAVEPAEAAGAAVSAESTI